MQQLGILDSLIATMMLPMRYWRVSLLLGAACVIVLLACVFWFDDSAVFGYPIDYTVLGMRMPFAVFSDHGWRGLAIWLASAFLFISTLAVWSLAISQGGELRLGPEMLFRRAVLFFAANLLVPIAFVPLFATVLLMDLEDMMRDEARYGYAFNLSVSDLPLIAIVIPLPIWLCSRLALWPMMILFTGWRGAMRRAWTASRGIVLRLLCHIVVIAAATAKIFDALSYLSYRLQFELLDYATFDTAVLVIISSVGIICAILLGYWTSALMVLYLPKDIPTGEGTVRDIF